MSLKKFEKKIDGRLVTTVAFAGREGFKIKAKLFRMVGPALGSIGKAVPNVSGIMDVNITPGIIGEMVGKLLENVDEDETLDFIMKRLLAFAEIDNRPAYNEEVFDDIFSRNFKFLYSVVWFVLESNYGDFFAGAGIGNLLKKTEPVPATKTES